MNNSKTLWLHRCLMIFSAFLCIFLLVTIYFLFFRETSKSYSLTQSWQEYYSLKDWNLTMNAIVDMDSDGKKDIVTFANCAFLSSVTSKNIPIDKQCRQPGMSIIAFPDNSISVGQKLVSQKPLENKWLGKSYLVKTKPGIWKFYNLNGLEMRVYEKGSDNLFSEINPTYLDMIDLFTYQISHLGVVLFLFVFG